MPATLMPFSESNKSSASLAVAAIGILVCSALPGSAEDEARDRMWKQSVLPLLRKHCFECHDNGEPEAGLTLSERSKLLAGGVGGPVVTPGNASASLLLQVLDKNAEPHMPPEAQLSADELAMIRTWIDRLSPTIRVGKRRATTSQSDHWAFQPLQAPVLPQAQNADWANSPIDYFILNKLEAEKLAPSRRAEKETLLRRVCFDLVGLPPSVDQQEQFLSDDSPDAYEKFVDRLLASPAYGERWGRHWLDLARYADSSGFHNDIDRPYAWRYRDYVVESFNQDKRYGQFVAEQLAGDQLASPTVDSWIATAFCRNGPSNDDNMGSGIAKQQYLFDQLDDIVSTTGNVFLGLTLGCARCHDHKYDPLTQRDYYSFLAYFRDTSKKQLIFDSFDPQRPKLAPSPTKPKTQDTQNLVAMVRTNAGNPHNATHILWRGDVRNTGPEVQPGVPEALRGSLRRPSRASVGHDSTVSARHQPELSTGSKATRLDLARWITDKQNPLTWRVLANRLWHYHFGRGLVATPSNFGKLGERPTHPELLDYLAHRLRQHDGGLKALHREIVTSATYCQSSFTDNRFQRDPDNRLLWRMNKRRLEAEPLRDAILAVAGNLNSTMGGPGIKPRIRPELLEASQRNKWPTIEQETSEHWRRSIYIYVKRQLQFPMMEMFGAPSTSHSCARRERSLVPTQSLVLLNDEFVAGQARCFARRVRRVAGADRERQVSLAMRIALGKKAEGARVRQAVDFLDKQRQMLIADELAKDMATEKALVDLCQVLINLSEFVYVE